MDDKHAKRMIKEVDKAREIYNRLYSDYGDDPFEGYDLMIDSGVFGVEGTASIIKDIIQKI